ncbi:patatin-like phospholipase family protein [Yinghuangia soli]|uniref:Patatin-like phospholipase family protein n=1 Tax=Yinghuangia soli TaxID=2908204 RepID=A0AA41U181_9ACTN|nr:patatin-like phospholipase family protein [Yinghuangia soli]MCF2527252.1 patatin-like phospholipase family protein [Yinghuangia soli]
MAIQGGAMRSIYALGAVRAMVDLGLPEQVGAVYSSSAGCVAGSVLAGQAGAERPPAVEELVDIFLDELSGGRFIDHRRWRKVVDVDLLVSVIRSRTGISVDALKSRGLRFEVAATDARTGAAEYFDLGHCASDAELFEVLRATMAIPLLYHRKVPIRTGAYIDGGISDPLPVLRCLAQQPTAVIAVSTVGVGVLGRPRVGREARMVQAAPGLSRPVRGLMLAANPLARSAEDLLLIGRCGNVPIHAVTPSDPDILTSRVETRREPLMRAEQLGYADAMASLAGISFDTGAPQGASG